MWADNLRVLTADGTDDNKSEALGVRGATGRSLDGVREGFKDVLRSLETLRDCFRDEVLSSGQNAVIADKRL